MTLTIELTPEQETQLIAVARREGLEPAELAQRLVIERLPDIASVPSADRVQALLARWQTQDNTPLAAPPSVRPGETPTQALFRQWEEADTAMTDAEREAEDRLWEEVEKGLRENRFSLDVGPTDR